MSRSPLTRDAVILRAADFADSVGFASISLSAIARSLSVQTPSLYSHVRDLSAVRDGVSILALQEMEHLARDAIAGRSGVHALRAICDVHREYARTHPGRWEALQRRASEDVLSSDAAARSGLTMAAVLRGYGIEETERVHATRLIGSFVNGFVWLEHIGAFSRGGPDTDASWEELLGRLHLSLESWSGHDRHATAPAVL